MTNTFRNILVPSKGTTIQVILVSKMRMVTSMWCQEKMM